MRQLVCVNVVLKAFDFRFKRKNKHLTLKMLDSVSLVAIFVLLTNYLI